MSNEAQGWHLDKRVPVALIIVLLLQLIGAVWSFATLTSKVEKNTENIERAEIRLNERINRANEAQASRYSEIVESLRRIEDKLDNKADK